MNSKSCPAEWTLKDIFKMQIRIYKLKSKEKK